MVGGDGIARHAVVLRGFRRLDERKAALALDGLQAGGAVTVGTGEDDADRVVLLVRAEGTEEGVDGHGRFLAGDAGLEVEDAAGEAGDLVGLQDVEVVGLGAAAFDDREHGHGRLVRGDLGEVTLLVRREVGDDDECHAGVGGEVLQDLFERLQTARGGSEGHDGEAQGGGLRLVFGADDGGRFEPPVVTVAGDGGLGHCQSLCILGKRANPTLRNGAVGLRYCPILWRQNVLCLARIAVVTHR